MQTAIKATFALLAGLAVSGCGKDEPKATVDAAPSTPVSAAPPPSAVPSTPPSATTPPPSKPIHDCPKGSTGDATFSKPCEAKGNARMMEAAWTGKTDDKGPFFKVTNKSPTPILYGKILVYFYDKAGKQLETKDAAGKTHPYHTCFGNMFGGVMKPGEKAVVQFSCVKKDAIPEGATAIEGEMQMVGFADSTEKNVEYYWKNADLTPDVRKKGGIK